jgi:hypothetical protein
MVPLQRSYSFYEPVGIGQAQQYPPPSGPALPPSLGYGGLAPKKPVQASA